jgi:hypothetical protein
MLAFMAGILRVADSGVVKTPEGHLGAIFIGAAHPRPIHTSPTTARISSMRLTKSLGFAGALVLSAVIGGTLIGSALATESDGATDAETSEYCDIFLDTLASELGTDRDGLVAAGKAAALAAVDAAVEAGDLTDEQADAARERIEAYDGSGCGWFGRGIGFERGFGHGFGHGFARGFLGGDVFEAAADALGIESSELIERLGDAGSLEALAEELGVSYDTVKASILEAVEADLDAAVSEGLSQERADAALERITTWLDNGGEVGGFHEHRRFGPWGGPDNDEEESGA